MRVAPVFLVAALLGAAPGASVAQQPAERARLDSIQARLAVMSDSAAMLTLERARIEYARAHRDDPFIHMELGWLALRLGDVTGVKRHYDEAAGEFEWASELKSTWPYAWYWLGVAELNIGESRVIALQNIREVLGLDHLSRAARAFARAIATDPAFTAALVDLASTTLRQRSRGRIMVALQALRDAAATPAASQPMVWLLRGRLERNIGASDSALAAFRRYLAVGGDAVAGRVELARVFAALNRPDSAVATYRAALRERVSDVGRAEIRRDLAWIAARAELARFDALPAESLGGWVDAFWSARDVDDVRRPGERLVEQFRRYGYASANFQLVSRRRRYDVNFALRDTTQSELDDRGVVYMRHGEPTERVRYTPPGTGTETSESWLYRRQTPEPDLIFHFAPLGDVQDYRLLLSLAPVCTRGVGVPDPRLISSRIEERPGAVDPQCFGARAGMAEVYDRLQRLGPLSSNFPTLLAEERDMVSRRTGRGLTSDSYRLAFAGDLRPVVSTFVVGDAALRPELHLVFAVPAGRLHPVETNSGIVYPLELRLVVFDSGGRRVAGLDTVRVFRVGAALTGGAFLTEQLVLPVPAGTWRAHLAIVERGENYGTTVRGQRVDAYHMAGDGFAASDVVVGRENSGLVWRRAAGGDVPLNPLARFPENSAALLYYEIYGLPEGAGVDTRVVLRPEGGQSLLRRLFGRRSGGDLSYTTVTETAGRAAVRQRLELVGLKPGRYVLEVTLVDQRSGRRAVRTDRFEIAGRAP